MKLCGIDVCLLPYISGPEYPPTALAYVSQIAACLGPTDAVEISQSHSCTAPLIGRILETSFDEDQARNDEFAPPHPYITNKDVLDGPAFFRVQIYMMKEFTPPQFAQDWPPADESTPHTITPAAPTNCVIWIHSSQILSLVFLPHVHHVINQKYGNLSGRADVHYVQYSLSFDDRPRRSQPAGYVEHHYSELELNGDDAYNMFEHPSNRPKVHGYISYSERVFESIAQVARLSDSMLVKTGSINRQVTKKIYLPRESWNYVLSQLETRSQEYLEFALNHHSPTKVKITTDNLTLLVDKAICTRYAITARNVSGFDALRAVVGRVGYGVKKKHPNLSAINANDGSNRLTVQEQDLIHLVHVDEEEVLLQDNSFEGVTHVCNPTRPVSNFVRLSYETQYNPLQELQPTAVVLRFSQALSPSHFFPAVPSTIVHSMQA